MTERCCAGLAGLALAVTLAVAWPAPAEEARRDAGGSGSEADAERVTKGKALYAQLCSHCHGFGMVNPGNVVPDLREFPKDDKQRFIDTVAHGRNNRMPPWGDLLSSEDIEELWAYIRSHGKS
jgi:cytochrome c55X